MSEPGDQSPTCPLGPAMSLPDPPSDLPGPGQLKESPRLARSNPVTCTDRVLTSAGLALGVLV